MPKILALYASISALVPRVWAAPLHLSVLLLPSKIQHAVAIMDDGSKEPSVTAMRLLLRIAVTMISIDDGRVQSRIREDRTQSGAALHTGCMFNSWSVVGMISIAEPCVKTCMTSVVSIVVLTASFGKIPIVFVIE